jgi:GAF domain-containing protein
VGDESEFESSLCALSQFFVGDRTMLETLTRVSEISILAIPVADLVGMTMLTNGRPATSVFSDPEAPDIDQAQYHHGEGPCLEAFRTGETRRIDSTAEETRWPEFCASCRVHGIHSTLSVPLTVDGETYGALNLYSRQKAAFGSAELRTATLFGAQAAIVLAKREVVLGRAVAGRAARGGTRQPRRDRAGEGDHHVDHALRRRRCVRRAREAVTA